MNFFKNYKSLFLSMSLLLPFSNVVEAKTTSNDDKYIFYKTYTNIGNLEVKDINKKTINSTF